MKIEIDQQDFGTLCICALRYCHGRRTYMPSMVQRIVMAHFEDLTDRDLEVIAKDEKFQIDMGLWGDACDMADWLSFYQILRKFRQEERSEFEAMIEPLLKEMEKDLLYGDESSKGIFIGNIDCPWK